MPRQSNKFYCPGCLQIARSTSSAPNLVCGWCFKKMLPAPARPIGADAPPDSALEDSKRDLDS